MRKRHDRSGTWTRIDGVDVHAEFRVSGGMVSVRIRENDAWREHGPAHLIGGNVDATVRRLLSDMR